MNKNYKGWTMKLDLDRTASIVFIIWAAIETPADKLYIYLMFGAIWLALMSVIGVLSQIHRAQK
jgi:hypothetical protein